MPKTITEDQWLEAVGAYELGTKHAVEIGRDLGVSAATVSREFKRRGARKACRVAESVAELEAALDVKAQRKARQRHLQEAAAMERSAELDRLVSELMRSIMAAERAGSLASAAPKVTEIGKALGVKGVR
jgi:IS30 family transposase